MGECFDRLLKLDSTFSLLGLSGEHSSVSMCVDQVFDLYWLGYLCIRLENDIIKNFKGLVSHYFTYSNPLLDIHVWIFCSFTSLCKMHKKTSKSFKLKILFVSLRAHSSGITGPIWTTFFALPSAKNVVQVLFRRLCVLFLQANIIL